MGTIFRYLTQKKVKIFSMALVIFYGSFIGLLILPAEGFNLPGQLGRPAEQRIPNTCQTLSGSSCVFPFTYKGVTHNQCTYADSPGSWCATSVSADGSVVTNAWGDCDLGQSSSCSEETLSLTPCTTTSGAQCRFPFRYKGVVYSQCTTIDQTEPWRATSVTSAGDYIEGSRATCPSSCPGAGGSGSTGGCTPGTIVAGECGNTCVCSSSGEPVCTNNPCTGSSTTSTTTTTTASTSSSTSCVTTSGPAVGQTCVFPFTWNGVTHNTCADWIYGGQPAGTRWCSTQTDSAGNHVNGQGFYGFCPNTCAFTVVSPQIIQTLSFRNKAASKDAISFGKSNVKPSK